MSKRKSVYTDEFRHDAVSLLLSSGRTLKEVANELGVTCNTLRFWRNRAMGSGSAGGTSGGRKPVERLPEADGAHGSEELQRLRRENEYLRRQRDILKKAMSILGEDPQLGMR